MANWTLLNETVLTGTTSSVTVTNIDQNYRDLVYVIESSCNSTFEFHCVFNNNSGGFYGRTMMRGEGTAENGENSTNVDALDAWIGKAPTTGEESVTVLHLFDYAQTDKNKTVLVQNDFSSTTSRSVLRYESTSAINRIEIKFRLTNRLFNVGSTFRIFGIEG